MSRITETIFGLIHLARLGLATGFRLRGRYWAWRWHTAFGAGEVPSRRERLRALLGYARWMSRMRRLG